MFRAFRRGGPRAIPQATNPIPPAFVEQVRAALHDLDDARARKITKAIGQATRVIMAKLAHMERTQMDKLDALLGAVETQQTKIDSLIAMFEVLKKQVKETLGSTITPSQAMRIDQIFDAVKANSEDIDRAITANTDEEAKINAAGAVTAGQDFRGLASGNRPGVLGGDNSSGGPGTGHVNRDVSDPGVAYPNSPGANIDHASGVGQGGERQSQQGGTYVEASSNASGVQGTQGSAGTLTPSDQERVQGTSTGEGGGGSASGGSASN